MISNLIRKIESNVEPSSWRSVGLGTMSVDEKTDRLIIAQSQPNQAKVWQYLQQLRSARHADHRRSASSSAAAMCSNPDSKPGQRARATPESPLAGMSRSSTSRPNKPPISLPMPRAIQISRSSAPARHDLQRPARLHRNRHQPRYVKDLHPVTSTTEPARPDWPAAPGYAADVGTVDSGILLDVQAAASADHKYISLTLKPQISNLLSMSTMLLARLSAGSK